MTEETTYLYRLVIGDWSDDGHGKSDQYVFRVNYEMQAIKLAYHRAVELSSVALHSMYTADVTPVLTSFQEHKLCSQEAQALAKLGVDFAKIRELRGTYKDECGPDEWCFTPVGVALLFMEMVRTCLSGFEYMLVKEEIPIINGFWSKDFNHMFGYGVYRH